MSIGTEARAPIAERAPDRAAGAPTVPRPPTPARLPGRRNPKWIALGVLALCLGGLLSYFLYDRAADESSVVVMTRTVYRGESIERDDLGTITVGGGSLDRAIPAAELEGLVGRRAALDLAEGAVLPRTALTDTAQPAPGRAVVGLKLPTGRAPNSLLIAGAPVRLVAMPAASDGSTSDQYAGDVFAGRVVNQTAGADGASIVLDVDVDKAAAATVALLAAQDRIAVVRDADR